MATASVREACKDRLPASWYYVLKKNKCLCLFTKLVYENYIPKSMKDKYHFRLAIGRIEALYKTCDIPTIATIVELPYGPAFWKNIKKQVIEYEYNCKLMENDLFEQVTWIKFKKPGLKEEVIKLGEQSEDTDEFRRKLVERYNISLTMAYSISSKFYKPKK